jgi:4'-phosphopantetheinyl transferase
MLTHVNLEDNEVHIWKLKPETAADISRYSRILGQDEQQRAARFYFPHLTRNFVVDHGRLRLILAAYTRSQPENLLFAANKFGKPELANPIGSLRFNLSHTEGMTLLAVCRNSPVGIDVEAVRTMDDWRAVAQSHFSPREIAALHSTTEPDQQNAFFRCWTRKEAFLKAHGLGLSIPLDSFAVSLARDEVPSILECTWDPDEVERWSLFSLDLGQGFAGALVISRGKWEVSLFDWTSAALAGSPERQKAT